MNEKDMMKRDRKTTVPTCPDYEKELLALLRGDKSDEDKRVELRAYHPRDIAMALEETTFPERMKLYDLLGVSEVSEVFSYLDDAGAYLREIGNTKAADVLEQMDGSDAAQAMESIDQQRRLLILSRMDKASREEIRMIRSYDDGEIGSYMTTNYIELRRGISIKAAMRLLRAQAAENDNLSTLYVVDDEGRYCGAIALHDLLMARKDDSLDDLIVEAYPYVYDQEEVDECLSRLRDYAEDSIPVINSDRCLLGVVTSQALVEAVSDGLNSDYARLAGLAESEDLRESLVQSIRKRLPWLLVLMVLGLVVSTVVGLFDGVMSRITVVVAFQSLILDMAGNVGTQSLAVTVRVLADRMLNRHERVQLLLKETRAGMCSGLMMGALSCVAVGFYLNMTTAYTLPQCMAVGGCLGLAMLLAMLLSSLMGTAIPMGIKAAGFDPAVASGPLITTLNDLVAVVSYYGLAMLLLIPVLG